MRIVIAERDQIGRRLLAQLLRMEGHDVLLIDDAVNAKGLMKQHRPDVVLMNMFSTHQEVRRGMEKTGRAHTDCLSPVVMMTSMGACEKLSAFMDEGDGKEPGGFDLLPANAKIGAMDHIQRICEVLARSLRSSERSGTSLAIRSSEQGLLDLYV